MNILNLVFNDQTVDIIDQNIKKDTVAITNPINHESVLKLVATLQNMNDYDGGLVTNLNQTVVTDGDKTFDVLQVLTETLNKPFALATKDDADETLKAAYDQAIWTLKYDGYHPGKDEYSVESLLTIGNGYYGIRGTLPEMEISDDHYPATYFAGLYNQAKSKIGETTVSNEDFVNGPNGQYLSIVVDGQLLDITSNNILSMTRTLNLKNGLLEGCMVVEFDNHKQVRISSKKVANMQDTKECVIQYAITPLNFSGQVTLVAKINGDVYNYNVARYRSLEQHHLDVIKTTANKADALLAARTKQSKFTIIQHTTLLSDAFDENDIVNEVQDKAVIQTVNLDVLENKTVTVEKYIHLVCLTDKQIDQSDNVIESKYPSKDFKTVLKESTAAWNSLWDKMDIEVCGDLMSQKLLHLHTYHLLVSASPNGNVGLDASITARGLHGEAYRGHIFWDEIFILPFYIVHFPATARQILMYRYDRLKAAKQGAKEAGYQGAMFPWQSGLEGTEQSQEIHLNPMTGNWDKDHSRLQRHVSLAVAYNVWLYWNNTKDNDFMEKYGVELLLEIAHFWQSAATYDQANDQYYIDKVMGPDEFHETYPGSDEGGFKNNAYTNMMVVWLFEFVDQLKAIVGQSTFDQIMAKTDLTAENLAAMDVIKTKLGLEIDDEGIIGQYEGYFKLKEVDFDYYRKKYGNIYRMDRILRAEGESADDYKVAKQADTLMIFYNFAKSKVDQILSDLNYQLPDDYLNKNLMYYLQRTSHGSTLSRVVHCQLAAMAGNQEMAWQLYQEALYSDYQDIQGGTTAEGIHAGVMAATIYITLSTFAGIDIRESRLCVCPNLPEHWTGIKFNIDINNINYQFDMMANSCKITANKDTTITFINQDFTLLANETKEFDY